MSRQISYRYVVLLTALTATAACSNEPAKSPDDGAYLATQTPEPRPDPALNEPDPGPPSTTVSNNAPGVTGNAPATPAAGSTPLTPASGTAPGTAAGSPPSNTPPAGTAPDNTKVNERDRSSAALTPVDQGNNESDLKITQKIRQAVMGNNNLSFTAKNVKIITVNGKVTLRGPVQTDAERAAIEGAAKSVAGAAQVDNQIEVKK